MPTVVSYVRRTTTLRRVSLSSRAISGFFLTDSACSDLARRRRTRVSTKIGRTLRAIQGHVTTLVSSSDKIATAKGP